MTKSKSLAVYPGSFDPMTNGHLEKLAGGIDIASLQLAGRPVKNLRANLTKAPGKSDLQLGQMRATVAGGRSPS